MGKQIGTLLCGACLSPNRVEEEDLGFDEFECGTCFCTNSVPATVKEFEAYNQSVRDDHERHRYSDKVRIMARQETGEVTCIMNDVKLPEEVLDVLIDGYKARHPEWHIFTEPEENYDYLVNQHILRGN